MPDIVLSTLNAKYIHASFGLRYLMSNLGELRERACLAEFTINQAPLEITEAVLAHQFGAVLREGDFAAVEGRLLHRGQALLFQQGDVEAAAAQGTGEAQAGRPGAHDDEVEFHGGAA